MHLHLILAAIPLISTLQFDCKHTAPREASLDLLNSTGLSVLAGAGSLRIEGRPGLRQARIRATACASSRELLDGIQFDATRSAGEIQVRANHDDVQLRNRQYARLDVVIEVPQGFRTRIDDGSGDILLYDLGAIRIEDGSGEITVQDANGDVEINDGSGEIEVSAVSGNVHIEDGSGAIDVHDIVGGVDITDSSGEVRVTKVGRDVTIRDGSGDIEVDGVRGGLNVPSDSSGDLDYRGVDGVVKLICDDRYDRGKKRMRFRLF